MLKNVVFIYLYLYIYVHVFVCVCVSVVLPSTTRRNHRSTIGGEILVLICIPESL